MQAQASRRVPNVRIATFASMPGTARCAPPQSRPCVTQELSEPHIHMGSRIGGARLCTLAVGRQSLTC